MIHAKKIKKYLTTENLLPLIIIFLVIYIHNVFGYANRNVQEVVVNTLNLQLLVLGFYPIISLLNHPEISIKESLKLRIDTLTTYFQKHTILKVLFWYSILVISSYLLSTDQALLRIFIVSVFSVLYRDKIAATLKDIKKTSIDSKALFITGLFLGLIALVQTQIPRIFSEIKVSHGLINITLIMFSFYFTILNTWARKNPYKDWLRFLLIGMYVLIVVFNYLKYPDVFFINTFLLIYLFVSLLSLFNTNSKFVYVTALITFLFTPLIHFYSFELANQLFMLGLYLIVSGVLNDFIYVLMPGLFRDANSGK